MNSLPNSEQLRIHTHDAHVRLEQTLIPIIKGVSTRSQYADLLKIFYTFYAPVEDQLSKVAGIERQIAGVALRKAASLEKDLRLMEASTDEMQLCDHLPVCTNLSQAFGIMYVLEGSVLGGRAIANIVTKQLPSDRSLTFFFLLHYGDDTKNKWQQFKTRLDSYEDLLQADLMSAATETFTLFRNWIEKTALAPHA